MGSCPGGVKEETLAAWGLPRDLPEHLSHVELLQLPPAVDRVDWLPDHLRSIDLSGSLVSDLSDLPDDLLELDASYVQGVTVLKDLPPRLHTLDLRWTGIEDLCALGRESDKEDSDLRTLRAGGAALQDLVELPRRLTVLELVDVQLEDAAILPRGLRELYLSDNRVVGLRSLPPRLAVLSLEGVKVRDLFEFPQSLTSLRLQDVEVTLERLPQFLVELSWTLPQTEVTGSLPRSLRKLHVTAFGDRPVSKGDIPALPRALEHLAVTSAIAELFTGNKLPPNLRALDLSGFRGDSLGFELPDTLEELSLARSDLENLPELPAGLRVLDLSGISPAALATLDPDDLDGLERLVLQGYSGQRLFELPSSLLYLDVSGSRRLQELPPLPDGLGHLDVRLTGLNHLPSLPGSLHALAVSGTSIDSLEGLPSHIHELVVGAGQLRTLDGLPAAVRILRIEAPFGRVGASGLGHPDGPSMRGGSP